MKQQPIKRFVSRTIIYVVIIASTFYGLRFIFDFFNLLYTDIDNARYLLSAMAQSQAAIIAIVITVSLVAIQLGASAYSSRVVNIFKGNPELWFLLVLYGGSMLYDFIVLKILSEKIGEFYIFIAYWLFASALLALFPYVLSMMNILSPQIIIKRLLENVTLPYIKSASAELIEKDLPSLFRVAEVQIEKDPFLPVVDIIRNTFMRNDYETARLGLREMTNKSVKIINSYYLSKPSRFFYFDYFVIYYCKHLIQISKLFAERSENLILEAITNLNKVREITAEKKLKIEEYMIRAFRDIGVVSAEKGFIEATISAMDSIGAIGKTIPYEDYAVPIKQNLIHTEKANYVVDALYDIGVIAVKKWGVYAAHFVGRNLEDVGVTIAQKRLLWGTVDAARSLNDVGVLAINVEKNSAYDQSYLIINYNIIRPLKEIGRIAYEKGIKKGFRRSAFALWDIGKTAAIGHFNNATHGAAKALAELAILDEGVIEEELTMLKIREARIGPIEPLTEFWKFIEMYNGCLKELRASKDGIQNKEQS
jgi:hypothetical protein